MDLNVTGAANHTLTDLRVTTMSSEETLVEELDLSAASIGRNFSVKLQLKKLFLGIIKNQVEMLYSTNTCHNHNHHCYPCANFSASLVGKGHGQT